MAVVGERVPGEYGVHRHQSGSWPGFPQDRVYCEGELLVQGEGMVEGLSCHNVGSGVRGAFLLCWEG